MSAETAIGAHALIARLRAHIGDALRPLLPRGTPVALLDFPNYSNVGDSAIWAGQLAFLDDAGCPIVYRCEASDYSRAGLASRIGTGTILLSGGGNLGDLYARHQQLRERVIVDFPDRPVIQLAQTIHFQHGANLVRAKHVFNAHPNLTLLVRDGRSLEIARNEFRATSVLCPDMAFCLGPLPVTEPAVWDVICLLRSDEESTGFSRARAGRDVEAFDWIDEPATALLRAFSSVDHWSRNYPRRLATFRQLLWSVVGAAIARQRLTRGRRLLARGRVIVTDRLHGHILSLLLGRPHVVLDNSYGKLTSFLDTWTGQCELTHRENSFDDALRTAQALAADVRAMS